MSITEICLSGDCTACQACVNICPKKCIKMKIDDEGNLMPTIEENNCVECKSCLRVCQGRTDAIDIKFFEPKYCYAASRIDLKEYKRCASGGIGSIIMEKFLDIGRVFATRIDNKCHAVVEELKSKNEISLFCGSRYVQSIVGNSFYLIKQALEDGDVLFIGTPCQIVGLKKFLGKDYQNLYTCDLLCHGTVSYQYLDDEIDRLHLNKKNITNITFRGYEKTEDFWFNIWDKETVLYKKYGRLNAYFKGFLEGYTLRKCCHHCNYTKSIRVGDITLGDFIGLGNNTAGLKKNLCTMILINNINGKKIFDLVKQDIVFVERIIDEAVAGGASLREPFKETEKSADFRMLYSKFGYEKAVEKIIIPEIRKEKITRIINKLRRIILKNKDEYDKESNRKIS